MVSQRQRVEQPETLVEEKELGQATVEALQDLVGLQRYLMEQLEPPPQQEELEQRGPTSSA